MGSSDTSIKALLVIAWLVLFVEHDVVAIRSFASSDQEQKARPGMGSARSFGDEQDVDFNEDDLLTQEQKKMYFIEILLNNL